MREERERGQLKLLPDDSCGYQPISIAHIVGLIRSQLLRAESVRNTDVRSGLEGTRRTGSNMVLLTPWLTLRVQFDAGTVAATNKAIARNLCHGVSQILATCQQQLSENSLHLVE